MPILSAVYLSSVYTPASVCITSAKELSGPEYAGRFIKQVKETDIDVKVDTMVLDISDDNVVTAVNNKDGLLTIKAKAVVLAMGCRERPRGALSIAGCRASGIMTAGTA